jgi:hypothetical protein
MGVTAAEWAQLDETVQEIAMSGLMTMQKRRWVVAGGLFLMTPGIAVAQLPETRQPDVFHLEEATIEQMHQAIQDGQISCRGLVEAFVERARAYNGVCTQLVTIDGAPVAPSSGPIRAGSALRFPTATGPVSSVLPDVDQYAGLPLDLGRMEPTISDPTVQAQFGMVVGIPNAGQLNALSTLNLRGERSVTCKDACDGIHRRALFRRTVRRPAMRFGSTPTLSSGPLRRVSDPRLLWDDHGSTPIVSRRTPTSERGPPSRRRRPHAPSPADGRLCPPAHR